MRLVRTFLPAQVATLVAACAGAAVACGAAACRPVDAGTVPLPFDSGRTAFRDPGATPAPAITRAVVLPLVTHDAGALNKLDARKDWPHRVRDGIVRDLLAAGVPATASSAPGVWEADVAEVAEKALAEWTAAEEAALRASSPDGAAPFDAFRARVMELHPDRWRARYAEFADHFASNPFAPLARRRAELLAVPPPFAALDTLRAEAAAAGASHVAIPVRLGWAAGHDMRSGIKHRIFDATLDLELWDARSERVVWRGTGIDQQDTRWDAPDNTVPIDAALHGATTAALHALLAK